jgi:maltooligosyltrehalose synthase
MEARLSKLETTSEKTAQLLADIRSDLSILKAVSATKDELHKVVNEQTWKLITWTTGLGLALVTAVYFIAKNVK